jgi:hypothetical protein
VDLETFADTRPHGFQELDLVLKLNPVVFNTKCKLVYFSVGIPECSVLV